MEAAAYQRITRNPTENMAAYELVLAAKRFTIAPPGTDNHEDTETIERALALDPDYAHAHAWRACIVGQSWVYNWCADRDATWQTVKRQLDIALALNDSDVHRVLAAVSLPQRQSHGSEYHQQRAVSLNPNDDLIVVQQGELYTWTGKPEEGIEWIKNAMRLNPSPPGTLLEPSRPGTFCRAAIRGGDRRVPARQPTRRIHHAFLAAVSAMLGDAGRRCPCPRCPRARPGFSVATYLHAHHYVESDREHHCEALLKAALPA